jgi:hypothetical protein
MVTSISRSQRAERRVSPSRYKLLLTAHIMISVGWLGVVFAKLVLGLGAVTTGAPDVAAALYASMNAVNVAFPPLAIGTVVSGVLLSLGTKWGLVQHYWVATKLALTVGVIATAVQLGDRLVQQAIAAPSGPLADDRLGRSSPAHAGRRDGHLRVQAVGQDLVWSAQGRAAGPERSQNVVIAQASGGMYVTRAAPLRRPCRPVARRCRSSHRSAGRLRARRRRGRAPRPAGG